MFERAASTCSILCGLAVSLLSLLTCDSEPVTSGLAYSTPLRDYPVFFFERERGRLCRYSVVSGRLDTADIPATARKYEVSPDGKRLYFSDFSQGGLIFDACSFDTLGRLPFPGWPFCSPDGEYIAIVGPDLFIVKAENHKLILHDTVALSFGTFDRDSREFFAIGGYGTNAALYKFSLKTGSRTIEDLGAGTILPPIALDPTSRFLYLYRRLDDFVGLFQVFDRDGDTVCFEAPMLPGLGTVAVTPSGQYVCVTNPGSELFGPPPPSTFALYRPKANRLTGSQYAGPCEPAKLYEVVSEAVFTPDGRWLIGVHWGSRMGILIYDMVTDQVVRFDCENTPRGMLELRCQLRP